MSTTPECGNIVVGVDGSDHASMALSWALNEARLCGLQLRVVHAFPALVSYAGTSAQEYYPQVQKEAEEAFERALADLPPDPGVPVERSLVEGNPAGQLVEASRGASPLVVGFRGLGGFRGLRLGSVSIHCVQHAHCPVVVVRQND